VVNEVVLIGGNEEAASEFDVGSAFAFGDPFGVLLEERVEFFSGGDFTPFQEPVADKEDVFDEKIVEIGDVSYFENLLGAERVAFYLGEGGAELFFELVKLGKVVGGGVDDALLFVGSSAFAGAGTGSHGVFNTAFPVGCFTPPGKAEVGSEAAGEVDGFPRGVPGEV